MPEGRPPLPAELERTLMVEAGHRCAIPTCRTVSPLHIEHIEDWAKVKEHRFENMIVLCANCHGLKVDKGNPRHLDRKALHYYKANLALLNGRYSDYERRVIELFAQSPPENRTIRLTSGGDTNYIQLMYLLRDGMLEKIEAQAGVLIGGVPVVEFYYLTDRGVELVERWKTAQPIEDEVEHA